MRKLVYGTLALSAAMAVAFGANVKDADAKTSTWKVALTGDTLSLEAGSAKAIMVGVPSLSAGKGTQAGSAVVKVSSWDYYQTSGGSASVDVSKYSIDKVNYLVVKADYDSDAEGLLIEIPQSYKISKIQASKKGVISFNSVLGKTDVNAKTTKLEYYTDSAEAKALNIPLKNDGTPENPGKVELPNAVLSAYQQTGASVYIREMGETVAQKVIDFDSETGFDDTKITVGTNTLEKAVDNLTGEEIKMVSVGRRPSKAVKVNITKLSNAPKVTTNYVNGTISIPKGVAYTFGGNGDGFAVEKDGAARTGVYYKGVNSGTTPLVFNVGEDIVTGNKQFFVDVYTPGTDGDAGTPDSKCAHFVYNGQTATNINLTKALTLADKVTTVNKLVKAKFYWTANGYGVEVSNNDTSNAYRVKVCTKTVDEETGVAEYEVLTKGVIATLAKASVKKIDSVDYVNPKTAKADVRVNRGEGNSVEGLSNIVLTVERLGVADKVNPVFPGTVTEIANSDITVDLTNDKTYSFPVALGDGATGFNDKVIINETTKEGVINQELKSASNVLSYVGDKVVQVTFNKGLAESELLADDYASLISAFNETNAKTKLTDAKGFVVINNSTKAAVSIKAVKVGGKGSDKDNVLGFTFKMPKAGVTIKYVTAE